MSYFKLYEFHLNSEKSLGYKQKIAKHKKKKTRLPGFWQQFMLE